MVRFLIRSIITKVRAEADAASSVSQRLHRIDVRRAPRRQPAGSSVTKAGGCKHNLIIRQHSQKHIGQRTTSQTYVAKERFCL
jgi:hypothetical protein